MTYGQLTDGVITYFKPYRGGIKVGNKIVYTKSERVYNKYGWYRVETIADDGQDYQDGNVIYHFVGKPITEEEASNEYDATTADAAE